MAQSLVEFTSTGARTYPLQGLEYLDIAHLSAKVNGTPVSATFDAHRQEVTLAAAPAVGATIRVLRTTPSADTQRRVDFLGLASGSAGLTAALLREDQRQLNFILGEGRDVSSGLGDLSGMGVNAAQQWEATGKKIEDLALGVDASDAAVKSQLNAMVAGARLLPPGSNDDTLFVSSGEWDNRTPSQGRTHLGLGTAAVLNAGTSANNVAQFDSSARFPTADGRNIDLTNHPIQASIALRALATVLRITQNTHTPTGVSVANASCFQAANTRIDFHGTPWTNRVELNNSSDIDGSFSTSVRFALSAGTWRIRFILKAKQTSAGSDCRFAITNNDDTSAQTFFYDSGPMRIVRQFNASTQNYYLHFSDSLIVSSASAFAVVPRYTGGTSGAGNELLSNLFFQKISTSVAA